MDLFRKKSVSGIMDQASAQDKHSLAKHLGVKDLTAFGIAAIVGAGIFSTIGNASANGGPGVVLLFIFTAVACSFAAFAYAEFASLIPVSGSAYTYSYVAFGELVAWIIGWALIMEYAVGNITVAISWSDYFTSLLENNKLFPIHLPEWMTMDFLTAMKGNSNAELLLASGKSFENLEPALQSSYLAWQNSPVFLGLHIVADLPALLIIILITWLVYRGIKESRNASNIMVIIKISIV
jgi:APA family basic amino acid/polyamine antiporter